MVLELKDSHIYLFDKTGVYDNYDRYKGYPANSREVAWRYLSNQKSSGTFEYAEIRNTELGYIFISDFYGDVNYFDLYKNKDYEKIDEILEEFKNKKGLVIDVRSNNGGNDFLSKIVASRFADKKQIFSIIYWRTGENHNDFTSKERYIEPKGKMIFTKPVVVLTNRETFSAAESFVGMMSLFPQVTLIGGNTGGGSGGTAYFELPNGMAYKLTTKYETFPDGTYYEGTGIAPDIEVTNTEDDINQGIDRILEEAITQLN